MDQSTNPNTTTQPATNSSPTTAQTPAATPVPSTPPTTSTTPQTSKTPTSTPTTAESKTPPAETPPPASAAAAPSTPPMHGDHKAPVKTIILIVILAILAGVLLFVALNPFKKAPVTTTRVEATPTVSPAHAILTMNLDTTASETGILKTKAVDVNIDTRSNKISGVQFEVSYDPTIVANVSVKVGSFFSNPLTLLNQVDTKNGKIDFALGIQPTAQQVSGSGTIAIISYTVLPTATASVTKFSFLPKTQVIEQGILGSVLEKSIDLVVPIDGLSSTPSGKIALPTSTQ